MSARYRAAIVGLSWIAADPAGPAADPSLGTAVPMSHASGYAPVNEVEVVAGCDIVEEARSSFLDRWRSRWPEVRAYADYGEMLDRERPDIVSVVVPDTLHRSVTEAAIAAGARGIYLEKPVATNLEDARAALLAARRAGVAMAVNYTRRWYPEFVEARRSLRAGAIGPLTTIILEFGGPRAMLFRNHSHMIDLICYFAGASPDWVVGDLETGYEDYGVEYKGDGGRTAELEPGANAYIAFANGVRGILSGWKSTSQEVLVHLLGPEGRIAVDSEGPRVILNERSASRSPVPGMQGPRVVHLSPNYTVAGMEAAVRDVIASMETGRPTQSPPEEAWHTVAITDAILRSQAAGRVPMQVEPLEG